MVEMLFGLVPAAMRVAVRALIKLIDKSPNLKDDEVLRLLRDILNEEVPKG